MRRSATWIGIGTTFLLVSFFGGNFSAFADDEVTVSDIQDVEISVEVAGDTFTITTGEDTTNEEKSSDSAAAEDSCEGKDCEAGECEAPATTKTVATSKSNGGLLSLFFGSSDSTNAPASDANVEFTATHKQVGLLKVKKVDQDSITANAQAGWGVKSFCLDSEDNLLVAVGHSQGGQLQQLSPEGELLNSWTLPVAPEALNVDTEGNFLIGGEGEVFRLNKKGEVLLRAKSPVSAEMEKNRDALRKQVIQQMKSTAKMMASQRDRYQQMIDQQLEQAAIRLGREECDEYKLLKQRLAKYEKSANEKLTMEEENAWALRRVLFRMLDAKVEKKLRKQEKDIIKIYKEQIAYSEDYMKSNSGEPTEEQIEQSLTSTIAYKSRIASVSASGSEVFLATGAAKGYGFDVWRFDENFENPEKIVTQLRGCCGQMDVQCCEAGVFVAENSRHQVVHYDRTGEKLNNWGKGARSGVRGFGGCCNPMNVAFGPDGSVYTAESETGRIKRFSPEGELLNLVGSVELVPGCKKVSIAATKDGSRIYMLDITRNHILIMEAKGTKEQMASKEAEATVTWSAYPSQSILGADTSAGN